MSTSILPILQAQTAIYGMTTLMVLGITVTGNAFIVVLFFKNGQNSCSLYLLSASILNIIVLAYNVPTYVVTYTEGDPMLCSLGFCKVRTFIAQVYSQIGRYYIVFACIDRYALTSPNVRLRNFSRISTARRLMVITFILWHILSIHLPIFSTIQNGRCGQFGLYYILYSVYLLITVCVFPSIVMAVFGYLAYRNMRQLHTRVRPTGNSANNDHENASINRRDRDLMVMVIAEVFCHFITMLLYPFIILESAATSYMSKSIERIQIENYILTVAIFFILTNNAMAFYIYIAVSKAFRRDFIQLITNCWRRVSGNREITTATVVSRSQRAPGQAET